MVQVLHLDILLSVFLCLTNFHVLLISPLVYKYVTEVFLYYSSREISNLESAIHTNERIAVDEEAKRDEFNYFEVSLLNLI